MVHKKITLAALALVLGSLNAEEAVDYASLGNGDELRENVMEEVESSELAQKDTEQYSEEEETQTPDQKKKKYTEKKKNGKTQTQTQTETKDKKNGYKSSQTSCTP